MRIIEKFILFVILFAVLLPTVFISNKLGFSNGIIQKVNAQVCGDGVISGDEECDTSGNIGCADPDEPFCNRRCTSCVCSESKFAIVNKPVICIVQDLILFLLSIIGGVALLMFVIGGILYIFAGANPEAQEKAKGTITKAIIGLIFVLIAYAIIEVITTLSV